MHPPTSGAGTLVVLPALNEEGSVGLVVEETKAALPGAGILVVDDGSTDATAASARAAGAVVVSNPFTLGVGGAMRVGFRYAVGHGYRSVVQVDADGQHDPRDIGRLLEALDDRTVPHTVIGARFSGVGAFAVPRARRLAMRLLAVYLTHVTHTTLSDVTSGFRAHNRGAVELFARVYPAEYLADTVESLVLLTRAGGHVDQVAVAMRLRYAGNPTQSRWRAVTYLLRVMVMLAVNVVRHQPPQEREESDDARRHEGDDEPRLAPDRRWEHGEDHSERGPDRRREQGGARHPEHSRPAGGAGQKPTETSERSEVTP